MLLWRVMLLIELSIMIKVYDPQKMTAVSEAVGSTLERKISFGGSVVGLSSEKCFVVSQPVFRAQIAMRDAESGFHLKLICEDSDDLFSFFQRMSQKLPSPHEATIEVL